MKYKKYCIIILQNPYRKEQPVAVFVSSESAYYATMEKCTSSL